MNTKNTMTIDGKTVAIDNERNLLELVRKQKIDIPTFCYHSELSVYGACRLCLVDVEGRGLLASCSVEPQPGMVVRTNTAEIRRMRKINIELLLANHHQSCPTCPKNGSCDLQNLARRLGVSDVRFKPRTQKLPLDESSVALVRDPNKCVLCGDCVRFCREVQDIGAIDFTNRGSATVVAPAFNKGLGDVECVNCGQCAAVCPTGAITPRSEVEETWKPLDDEEKVVVAQIAPAVRVAIGEQFGMQPGEVTTGKIVAALKMLGFDKVFDTSFTADLTVIEEANEFIDRMQKGENLPQFTSCCPGWVKFAEQYYPELLDNLSTCRSPQQMFGSVARRVLPDMLGVDPENLVIVSIMPCTAKKFEAKQDKFENEGTPDVDHVLTTQELTRMIEQAGLCFNALEPESLDIPLGFKTGAGVIFGTSGGVSEAVLRYAAEKLENVKIEKPDFKTVRGAGSLREAKVNVGGKTLRIAIVHGLRRARRIAEDIRIGNCEYDLVEVMACPGGCVGGAGQPVTRDVTARQRRAKGLYQADTMLQLHKPQENHYITELYEDLLGEVNGPLAHRMLHTEYQNRKRIQDIEMNIGERTETDKLPVQVCLGTSCYVKGSQNLMNQMIRYIEQKGLEGDVDVKGTFCFENCNAGPNVRIGDTQIANATFDKAIAALEEQLMKTAT